MDNYILILIFDLILCAFFAALIGYNRGAKNHVAGVRTHVLVAIGSLLSILVPYHAYILYPSLHNDPFRLSAQVISGIGFLGVGTIIKSGKYIRGLTTAASLWLIAIISIAIGAGFYLMATLAFILAFIFLEIYVKISLLSTARYNVKTIVLEYDYTPENKDDLIGYLFDIGINEKYETVLSQEKINGKIKTLTSIQIKYIKEDINIETLIENLIEKNYIKKVDFQSELEKLDLL